MDRQDRPTPEDDDIARLLRAAGPREQLPGEMRERWEQQFRRELQPVLERRGRSRRRWLVGLCASLALLVGAFSLTRSPPDALAPEIRISHVSGDSRLLPPGEGAQDILAGQPVTSGSIIDTGADGLVAIQYGDYDLRLNHRTRLLFGAGQLQLESGELYASDYGVKVPGQPLRINTAHGAIRDIGTQFTVAAYPDRTVTTVRRGAVLIDTGREELRAEPLPGTASRLIVDRELHIQRQQVAPGGEDWNWIYLADGRFTLEGKTAYDFLEWSVRESGLTLEFGSEGAKMLARSTRLHGDISGLNPEQAVAPVLATTDLVATPGPGHTLRININR